MSKQFKLFAKVGASLKAEQQYLATLSPADRKKRMAYLESEANKVRAARKPGLIGGMVQAVTSVPGQVSSAVTGRRGLLGGRGMLGELSRGKIANAVKMTGAAVSKVTSNHMIQASFGSIAVPASLISAVAAKGPKGALSALKNAAENPIVKAELAAVAVVIPPLAPVSAGGIAAMEATSRIVDGINSKDPAKVAQAVMQVAGTQLAAKAGNAGAERALTMFRNVDKARKVATGATPAARQLLATVKQKAAAGDPKAKTAVQMVQHQAIREAQKTIANKAAAPAQKARARNVITAAQTKAPALLSGTMAGMVSPRGVRAGDFSILSTGRVLYAGRPIRKAI